jgi:ketosteroid isomerase-like protein
MSSTNLDLVRSIYAAWERGDFSTAEWVDRDIKFVLADWPDAGTWSGLAGMTEGMRQLLSAWEDFYVVADESRELDDECVLMLMHVGGRGKASGLELQAANVTRGGAHVFHIRDRKVTRLVVYFDRDRAFADLGLAPEADATD